MKLIVTDQEVFDSRIKVDPDLKKKWLTHLKSGMYEKGRNSLLDNRQYCCLGVLCEVIGFEKKPKFFNERVFNFFSGMESDSSYLPIYINGVGNRGVFQGFKIDTDRYADISSLAELNDNTESFKEVIEVIEKYF